ncbi:MAG: hypothetical protein HZB71_11365 [Betaproteobacteria bacterium]|nr:hypothetical protein [Betaproteobacteria bacterium]
MRLLTAALLAWSMTANAETADCLGRPIAPLPRLLQPPLLPQPKTPEEVAAVNIQNLGERLSPPRMLTFGLAFDAGRVRGTEDLKAIHQDAAYRVQIDPLALWRDGTVRLAAITAALPALCAGSELTLMLTRSKATEKNALPPTPPPRLVVALTFGAGRYAGVRNVDFTRPIQAALAGKPDYWLRGPLATQFRVEVPLQDGPSDPTATLRLTADITQYADGASSVDMQFNNDRVSVLAKSGATNPAPPLPPLEYRAEIRFGPDSVRHEVRQDHYTNWHAVLHSDDKPPLHVQQDVTRLRQAGVILPYDLTTGVHLSLLQDYEKRILNAPGFGQPLAANGVTMAMPNTGGRPDIGFTTQYNTVWLLTQDVRAARVALAQSDASGAIPWNYRLGNGHWLTPGDHPEAWVDPRGGPQGYTGGIARLADTRKWIPDNAHQPDLSFIPYLLTGNRWNHDRMVAQAAFGLSNDWTGYRCKTPKCNTVLNGRDQVRAQAWNLRGILQAALFARTGSFEQTFFAATLADNWRYAATQWPALRASQGEAWGWAPGAYGGNAQAPWQQDFLTGVAAMAARMGDEGARAFLRGQRNWLTGRFLGKGLNPRNGCANNLMVIPPDPKGPAPTWAAIDAASVAAGVANTPKWGAHYYCAVARGTLGAVQSVFPEDEDIRRALAWLNRSGAPYIDPASSRNDPTFNIVE